MAGKFDTPKKFSILDQMLLGGHKASFEIFR